MANWLCVVTMPGAGSPFLEKISGIDQAVSYSSISASFRGINRYCGGLGDSSHQFVVLTSLVPSQPYLPPSGPVSRSPQRSAWNTLARPSLPSARFTNSAIATPC